MFNKCKRKATVYNSKSRNAENVEVCDFSDKLSDNFLLNF